MIFIPQIDLHYYLSKVPIMSPSTFGFNYVGSNKRRHLNIQKKLRNKRK